MPIQPGSYAFGPESGTIAVRTGRTGAAAKAGHNLVIHVTDWQATLAIGEDAAQARVDFEADSTSLRVRSGTGGMQGLDDDDKESIRATIDDEVLRGQRIRFRSTSVQVDADGSTLAVRGELTLVGTTRPLALDLAVAADGTLSGSTIVKQSEWGIKPYSTLYGALKVVDEVEIRIDAVLSPAGESPSILDQEAAPWP